MTRLLDIHATTELEIHPFRGAIFENWCINQCLQAQLNQGKQTQIFFWRDRQREVDILLPLTGGRVAAIECKSAITPSGDFLTNPMHLKNLAPKNLIEPHAVYAGEETQHRTQGILWSWKDFGRLIGRVISGENYQALTH